MGFTENLRERRIYMGMTQVDLANAIGVSDRTIQKYEAGRAIPNSEILSSLADALNISLDELMGNKKRKAPSDEAEQAVSTLKALFMGGDFDEDEKKEIYDKISLAFFDAKLKHDKKNKT